MVAQRTPSTPPSAQLGTMPGGGGSGCGTDRPGGSGTLGQGNSGGRGRWINNSPGNGNGGGGGGSSSAGTNGASRNAGNIGGAGSGTLNEISGSAIIYAAGGDGGPGRAYGNYNPPDQTGNSGNGGIGGTNYSGGNGANGIVVLRYNGNPIATGGTITQSGGYTIHSFTQLGNSSIVFQGGSATSSSSSVDEQALRSEFDQFLSGYSDQVALLNDADLSRYKTSVLSNLQETPKNLAELNSRFMESVGLGYRDFDFRDKLADEVSRISLGSLKSAYSAVVLNDIRGLAVETAAPDQKNTAIDLRKQGSVYQYDF